MSSITLSDASGVMACDAADLIAAAAPVAGGYKSLPTCRPSRPVAILEIHGAADHVVPYRGDRTGAGSVPAFLSQWRRLDGCRGPARRLTPRSDVVELRWSHCAGGAVVQHGRDRRCRSRLARRERRRRRAAVRLDPSHVGVPAGIRPLSATR